MSIRSEVRGQVLIVTLDRPEARNALSTAMREALIEVWQDFRQNGDLRVAILTGAGDKSFCAGADLKEIGDYYRSMTPIERREHGEQAPGWAPLLAISIPENRLLPRSMALSGGWPGTGIGL